MTKHRSVHTVSRGMKGQAALPTLNSTNMHVCVAWPCLTLYHGTPALLLSAPSLSLKHCLHFHTGTYAYSHWTVLAGWVPPCWCTPLNPLACDTSSWNAKQPQSLLSAARGENGYFTHLSRPKSPSHHPHTLSYTQAHTRTTFTHFLYSVFLQGKMSFCLRCLLSTAIASFSFYLCILL